MEEVCGDNGFEIIGKAKADLLENTNISSDPNEMLVLDSFLYRAWQMGWLSQYETSEKRYGNKIKTRIACLDFGRIAPEGRKVYVIEYKKHWYSRWKIRDWETKRLPRFYASKEEARKHL